VTANHSEPQPANRFKSDGKKYDAKRKPIVFKATKRSTTQNASQSFLKRRKEVRRKTQTRIGRDSELLSWRFVNKRRKLRGELFGIFQVNDA